MMIFMGRTMVEGALVTSHMSHRPRLRGRTWLNREDTAAWCRHPASGHQRSQEEHAGERKQNVQTRLAEHVLAPSAPYARFPPIPGGVAVQGPGWTISRHAAQPVGLAA
jgi:hypothetical protein